jgi:hypothetical protein
MALRRLPALRFRGSARQSAAAQPQNKKARGIVLLILVAPSTDEPVARSPRWL